MASDQPVKEKDGGPAFPNGTHVTDSDGYSVKGMSLRDYFAAKAMQGYIASGKWGVSEAYSVAGWAYVYADAMLKEREK